MKPIFTCKEYAILKLYDFSYGQCLQRWESGDGFLKVLIFEKVLVPSKISIIIDFDDKLVVVQFVDSVQMQVSSPFDIFEIVTI
jgi:hypothetical protein